MTKANDVAWEKYIEFYNIHLDGSLYFVDAKKLKEVTGREPRLLAKIDEPSHLPEIFRKNGYSILAVTNGKYLLFKGNIFADIPNCKVEKTFIPKLEFPLETTGRGSGESEYLDNAFNTGVISEFAKSEKLYLTIRGRERVNKFEFVMRRGEKPVNVDGVQIEVDAGFEGKEDVILVEGKIGNRKSFNIRQLYYPYRHFKSLVPNKNIRSLFFTYDLITATYSLFEFGFREPEVFNSIYLIDCCVYRLAEKVSYKVDDLFDEDFESNKDAAPQADDLNKVLELLNLIRKGENSPKEIADHFFFDQRQSYYYGEAAEFLGLITRKRGVFEFSKRGYQFVSTEPKDQQMFIAKTVISSQFFQKLIKLAKRKGYYSVSDIQEAITDVEKPDGTKRYTKSTIGRRVQTTIAWSKWLSDQFNCFKFDGDRFILK